MVVFELQNAMKGSDLANLLEKEFKGFAQGQTETVERKRWFKRETNTRPLYGINVFKNVVYKQGDSGPKEEFLDLKIELWEEHYYDKFGLGSRDNPYKKIVISIPCNKEVKSLDIECLYYSYNSSEHYNKTDPMQSSFLEYDLEPLLKAAVKVVHQALYGKPEDSAAGLDKAEKIL